VRIIPTRGRARTDQILASLAARERQVGRLRAQPPGEQHEQLRSFVVGMRPIIRTRLCCRAAGGCRQYGTPPVPPGASAPGTAPAAVILRKSVSLSDLTIEER